MRGIVSKNIENCKKKLLLQKLREHSQSFQFFVHGVSNAAHAHCFLVCAKKSSSVQICVHLLPIALAVSI